MGIIKLCDTNEQPQGVDVTDGAVHVALYGESIDDATGAITTIDLPHILLDWYEHETI